LITTCASSPPWTDSVRLTMAMDSGFFVGSGVGVLTRAAC
jgi:hypothetical protein